MRDERIRFLALGLIIGVFAAGVSMGFFHLVHEEEDDEQELEEAKLTVVDNSFILAASLDKDLLEERIKQGNKFLLRSENEEFNGFYKYFYPFENRYGDELVTVYSSSIVYTFMYVNNYYEESELIKERLQDWGDFLLSMQKTENVGGVHGAFHYAYDLNRGVKENRFVVGTAALTIFTLLEMYDLTEESVYLESAEMAGNWLISMQNADGTVKPYRRRSSSGQWFSGTKESLLYQGQVLSALSRLYRTTGVDKYYDSAEKIADRYASMYEGELGYVEGEYRDKNPISNSWVVMSLLDFYKASQENRYRRVVLELSEMILDNQYMNKYDPRDYGRWRGAYSTSGNGWICEVMTEVYRFRKETGIGGHEKYKEAVLRGFRWIVQNTYSEEHQKIFDIPDRAIGGVFWNKGNRYVRTDSNCHAMNAYILLFPYLEKGTLVTAKGF
ncbi:MAG: hypothetical protein ACLFUR_03925 [Candidatus Hadarchaeia archaeon]